MKTIDVLKNLGVIRNLKNLSETEKKSPNPTDNIDGGVGFALFPQNKVENTNSLRETLSNKPLKSDKGIKIDTKPTKLDFFIKKNKESLKNKSATDNLPSFKSSMHLKSQDLAKTIGKERKKSPLIGAEPRPQPNPGEGDPEKKVLLLKEFLKRNYTQQLLKSEEKKTLRSVTPLDRLDDNCTFKPSLNEKSLELVGSYRIFDLFEQGERIKKEKKKKLEEAQKKKQAEELNGCTFTPKILKKINVPSKLNFRHTPEKRKNLAGCYRSVTPTKISMLDCLENSS